MTKQDWEAGSVRGKEHRETFRNHVNTSGIAYLLSRAEHERYRA